MQKDWFAWFFSARYPNQSCLTAVSGEMIGLEPVTDVLAHALGVCVPKPTP